MSSYVRMVLNPILKNTASIKKVSPKTLTKALDALKNDKTLEAAGKVVTKGLKIASADTGRKSKNPVKVPRELLGYLKYLLNRNQISNNIYLKAADNLRGAGTYHRFQILMRQLIIALAKPKQNSPTAALLALAQSKTVRKYAKAGGKKLLKYGSKLAKRGAVKASKAAIRKIDQLEKKSKKKLGNPLTRGESRKKCCPYCGSLQIVPLYKLGSKKISKLLCRRCGLWHNRAKTTTRGKFVKKFKAELIEVKIAKKNAPKSAKVTKTELKKYSTKAGPGPTPTKITERITTKIGQRALINLNTYTIHSTKGISKASLKSDLGKWLLYLIKDHKSGKMRPAYKKKLLALHKKLRPTGWKLIKPNPCATVAGNPKRKKRNVPSKPASTRAKGNHGPKFYERCTAIEFSDGKQIQRITIKNNTNLCIVGRPDGSVDIIGTGASSIPAMGMAVTAIEARKGKNSLWAGELFRHKFTSRPTMKKIANNKVKLVPKRRNGKVLRLHKVFKY